MVAQPSSARTPADRRPYRHEAVLWSGLDQFLDNTAEFVRGGLRRDEPVMVATVAPRLAALRWELGEDAERVRFVDMADLGANPARIIQAWIEFSDSCGGAPSRGVGEPLWAGRRDAEVAECQLHEALLNLAIPAEAPLWLRCPYESSAVGEDVIHEAERGHPAVLFADGRPPRSDTYAGDEQGYAAFSRDLEPPERVETETWFDRQGLHELRALVLAGLARHGLSRASADDVALAVHELAANSVQHGGGWGRLRIWREPGAVVCEVHDSGYLADPLAGRLQPDIEGDSGRGLWMVNQLCDLVQLRSGLQGTTVRVHSWLTT